MQNEKVPAIINSWKNKLLDLSKRNRALNFRINKVTTISIIDELPANIFRVLCVQKKSIKFNPYHSGSEIISTNALSDFEVKNRSHSTDIDILDDALKTNSTPDHLDKSLRRIEQQSRTLIEEQGINSLFLTLGMLNYKESGDSKVFLKAPILLIPVELRRKSAIENFTVSMNDEEIIVNPSLIEYLQRNYDISLPELNLFLENNDISGFFKEVNLAIAKQKRWKIEDESYLSLFSFQKLAMYKDLEKNLDKIATHRVAQQIIQRQGETFINLPNQINKMSLDEDFSPENSFQVVDADSSQLRAIATAAKNYDLVLEGPPGTGKSQTITNLIAQAISMGKNVLFVAEKMAALDVVYRRLCDIGLGESCLELHSTKANKRSVLKDLEHSLNSSAQKNLTNPPQVTRLPQVRQSLTNYINSVHQAFGTLNLSPFEMYGELDKVFDAPKMPLEADISETTTEDLHTILQDINDLVLASEYVGAPRSHPWRETTKTYYSQFDLDEINRAGTQLIEKLQDLLDFSLNLENTLGLPFLKTLEEIENIHFIAKKISTSPGAPLQILQSYSWDSLSLQMKELINEGRRLQNWRGQIEQDFTPQVFKQEPNTEIAYLEKVSTKRFKFLLFLDRQYINIKQRWMGLRQSSYNKSLFEQIPDMKSVADYLSQLMEFNTNRRLGGELFGNYWKSETSDWEELERFIDWVVEFRQIRATYRLKEAALKTATKLAPNMREVNVLQDKINEIQFLLRDFCDLIGWQDDYFANTEIEQIKSRITDIVVNLDLAHRWTSFESARQKLQRGFGQEVLNWVTNQEVKFEDLPNAFRRAFYQKWLTRVLNERQELREMHVPLHEQRIKEFQDLSEKILLQNRFKLLEQIRENIQQSLSDSNIKEQILLLRSELTHKNINNPLRLTMQKCIDAIRTIKPCFMMSPQSVAQLLDTDNTVFDLVIFDEASQLPVEDALGSIIRGRQVVIVGDPKQLPPTNFFNVSNDAIGEKDDESLMPVEDSNSILEEALNCGIPNSSLRWHYRSSHESLINFSNSNFYDSQLYSFPSVETEVNESGLHFEFVPDGIYEGKGVNQIEARRVADAVIQHAKKTPHISLGVGTFSAGQQMAIQDELENRRRKDTSLESFFDHTKKDPFFVKNLENIQGDEREVIFLSIGYAKARDGKLRYNFGPLNGEHGWRRMNVLTTRAKNLMYVFSSIKAEDINLLTTNSRGAKLLRDFLRFAEQKTLENYFAPKVIETESAFEKEVYRELTNRGLTLVPKIGVSDYRVDFGVLDTKVTGKFICGIECDGISYYSAQTACDRDHLRQKALAQRGWEIHRVWSTDWFKDRSGQIERLLNLIENSRQRARDEYHEKVKQETIVHVLTDRLVVPKTPVEPLFRTSLGANNERFATVKARTDNPLNFTVKAETPTKPNLQIVGKSTVNQNFNNYIRPTAKPYQTAKIDFNFNNESLVEASVENISKVIKSIVSQESPIYIKDLLSRTAAVWDEKAGSNSARLIEITKVLAKSGELEMSGDFVYQVGGKIEIRSRKGADASPDFISPEEIIEAVFQILYTGHKFSKQNLINETRTVFGINRTKTKLQQTIEFIVNDLLENKVIYEDGRGIGLVTETKPQATTVAA